MNTTSPARQPQFRLTLPRGVTGFRDRHSEPLPKTVMLVPDNQGTATRPTVHLGIADGT